MATTYVTTSERTRPLYRGTQIVWYILNVIEFALGVRLVLKLLGANPGAPFTDFVYSITYPLVAPFLAVFRTTSFAGFQVEWSTILAMIVYYAIALGLVRLLSMNRPVSRYEAAERLYNQDQVL